jgi:hypothetical protein
MLRHSRTFLAWTCFVFVLAMATWGATFSPSYQKCTADNEHYYRQSERPNFNETVLRRPQVPLFLLCEGKFIDENAVSLTLLATIAIAGFTLTLWRATTEHGRVMGSVLNLARDEFNAAHRPKLVIREVDIFWAREHTDISFVMINEGNATAYNIEYEFKITERISKLVAAKRKINFPSNSIPFTLEPGKIISCKGIVETNMPEFYIGWHARAQVKAAQIISLEFEGFANYTGSTNLARHSAYYRPFDPETISFMPSNDPEKEYPG